MAAVYNEDTEMFCGGTLISSKYVVSAAHCVYRNDHQTEFSPADLMTVTETYSHVNTPISTQLRSLWETTTWSSRGRPFSPSTPWL